ncbi:MAG: class I SAM-dependent methyltransferase [Sphingomonas fennica]
MTDREASARAAAAYDATAYPPGVFQQTHPGRLAAIARLHGLSPPPIETARVLELGGGDGLNLAALAAAYPQMRCLSLDIAPQPVLAGRALAAMAGLDNIRIDVADVLDTATTLEGPFDYVIAHGLYAWVPDDARAATMATIARVLAPDGVAFLSYNARPGGQIRAILRDMALFAARDAAGPAERLALGRAALLRFADEEGEQTALAAGMRQQARLIAERPDAVLTHDELSGHYHPQSLTEVSDAAAAVGLAYLNDAEFRIMEALPGTALPQAEMVAELQALDHRHLAFFRSSLLVRADRAIGRRLDVGGVAGLWLESRAVRQGDGRSFRVDAIAFEIGDDRMCELMAAAQAVWPVRVPLAPLKGEADRLEAFVRLLDARVIRLHAGQLPVEPLSDRPRTTGLVRAQIARGDRDVARLDQSLTRIEPWAAGLLPLLDGTRDRPAIDRAWTAGRDGRDLATALEMLRTAALLIS